MIKCSYCKERFDPDTIKEFELKPDNIAYCCPNYDTFLQIVYNNLNK